MNSKITIIDEQKYSATDLKNVVCMLRVWSDFLGIWKKSIFKKKFSAKVRTRKNQLNVLRRYQGSSEGDNKPSKEILNDIRKSSKNAEIEILEFDVDNLSYSEQYHLTKYKFPTTAMYAEVVSPITGEKVKEFYNKNNGIGSYKYGFYTPKKMMNYVQTEILWDMIQRHNNKKIKCPKTGKMIDNPEYHKIFKKRKLSRLLLSTLLKLGRFIQSRLKKEGNEDSIDRYSDSMEQIIDEDEWSTIWVLEGKSDDEEDLDVLDGNQSVRAVLRKFKFQCLNAWVIPYKYHKFMSKSSKESIGNGLNAMPEGTPDYSSMDCIERDIDNTLDDYDLFKNGKPQFNNKPILDIYARFPTLTESQKNEIEGNLRKKYKEDADEKKRGTENTYDFRNKTLKKSDNTKKHYDKLTKKIIDKFDENNIKFKLKHKVSEGFEFEKTFKLILEEHYKSSDKLEKRTYPKSMLVFVTYLWGKNYDDSKNDLEKLRSLIHAASKLGIEMYIVRLNPYANTIENFDDWFQINEETKVI